MSTELARPSSGRIAIISGGSILPAAIADAGDRAAKRFVEFFTAIIRNPHTRKAYARAAGDFFASCEQLGLALPATDRSARIAGPRSRRPVIRRPAGPGPRADRPVPDARDRVLSRVPARRARGGRRGRAIAFRPARRLRRADGCQRGHRQMPLSPKPYLPHLLILICPALLGPFHAPFFVPWW